MKKKELVINGAAALSEKQIERIMELFDLIFGEGEGAQEETQKQAPEVPDTLDYYLVKLAEKMNWHPNKLLGFLNKMAGMSLILPYSLLLKEIAVELDKKYHDHIKNSEEIWTVSLLDGSIVQVNKFQINTYSTFAAFRTPEDAQFAIKVLADQHKEIFGGE